MPKKILAYSDENSGVYLQPIGNVVHIHCYVTKWTHSQLKKLYNVFNDIVVFTEARGFEFLVTVTPNPKFARLFGGEVINELTINGEPHEVIIWELKPH